VAAPAYLAAKGVPRTPDDLKAHACLHHKFPTSGKFERWPLWPEHAGIESELPKTAVASTLEPIIFMAEQGMGIAYLPDFAIGRQLREGVLVTVLDTTLTAPDPFGSYGRRAGISLPSKEHS
jgi:DNA-binding transcriptional LysR family regulator